MSQALSKGDPKAYAAKPRNTLLTAFEEVAPAAIKEPVDKVDLADVGNAQSVIPYLNDIHRHYREAEVRLRARPRPATGRVALRTCLI